MKKKFNIIGMGCAACSAAIEKELNGIVSVNNAEVNLLLETMVVDFDQEKVTVKDIEEAVKKAGYKAVIADDPGSVEKAGGSEPKQCQEEPDEKKSQKSVDFATLERREMKRRLVFSVILAIPLMYVAMGDMLGMAVPLTPDQNYIAQVLLTIPIAAINYKYFWVGFKMMIKGHPNMDSLIAVGSAAAMIYGYWESAAMILTLVTLGKMLESGAKGKTGDAIGKLMDLAPPMATLLRDGAEVVVSVEEVKPGDLVAIKPGERIPADGIVHTGETEIDESALTGESVPVAKKAGDQVSTATVNTFGYFVFEATKVGEDTTLAQIIGLIEEASAGKPTMAKLADKVAGVFVPVVMGVAVLAAGVWLLLGAEFGKALEVAIAILVVSCPCALGLATPVAVMVGIGRGALEGVLFKSSEALERAGTLDIIMMDKTGTITEGKPSVTDIFPESAMDREKLLALAATLERPSEHPLGKAILKEAVNMRLPLGNVEAFEAKPGMGIEAIIEGHSYAVGTLAHMEACGIHIPNKLRDKGFATFSPLAKKGEAPEVEWETATDMEILEAEEQTLLREGKTVLYVGGQGLLFGRIALKDKAKESAKDTIHQLKAMGIEIYMVTGDKAETGRAIGDDLGISKVIGEVKPAEKSQVLEELRKGGRIVAMVGDGINDGPAIAAADVGIAMGSGTDVALESADVVLKSNNLKAISRLVSLSQATVKNMKQNLFWAFFYNALGIPLAAGVLYPFTGWTLHPMFAAAAMCLSSVCVVTNALRLRHKKIKHSI